MRSHHDLPLRQEKSLTANNHFSDYLTKPGDL